MADLNVEQIIARIIVLIVAFTLHELAHAYVADYLGDSTPRKMGRITLNPIYHLDPIGSILLILSGFGWAKPVLVNPNNLRGNKQVSMAIVALAGPVTNLLIALFFILLLRTDVAFALFDITSEYARVLSYLFLEFASINIILMFFNLIPIPPLDGFTVFLGGLPNSLANQLAFLRRYGFIILIVVIFVLPGVGLDVLDWLVWRPSIQLREILLGEGGMWRLFYGFN